MFFNISALFSINNLHQEFAWSKERTIEAQFATAKLARNICSNIGIKNGKEKNCYWKVSQSQNHNLLILLTLDLLSKFSTLPESLNGLKYKKLCKFRWYWDLAKKPKEIYFGPPPKAIVSEKEICWVVSKVIRSRVCILPVSWYAKSGNFSFADGNTILSQNLNWIAPWELQTALRKLQIDFWSQLMCLMRTYVLTAFWFTPFSRQMFIERKIVISGKIKEKWAFLMERTSAEPTTNKIETFSWFKFIWRVKPGWFIVVI